MTCLRSAACVEKVSASRCLLERDLPRGIDLTTETAMESPHRVKGVDEEGNGAWAGESLWVVMVSGSLIESMVRKVIPTTAGQPMAAARDESERVAETRYLVYDRPCVWQSLIENSIKQPDKSELFRPRGETLYPLLGNHSSPVRQLCFSTFQVFGHCT